jgi:hypothetical protein
MKNRTGDINPGRLQKVWKQRYKDRWLKFSLKRVIAILDLQSK